MTTDSLVFEVDSTAAESGSKRVVKSFQDIRKAAEAVSTDVVSRAQAMARALNSLSQVNAVKGSVITSIQALNDAVKGFKAPSQTAIDNMAAFTRILSRLDVSAATVRAVKSISDAFATFQAPSKAAVDNVQRLLSLFQAQPNTRGMRDIATGLDLIARNATVATAALNSMLSALNSINQASGRNGLGVTPVGGFIRQAAQTTNTAQANVVAAPTSAQVNNINNANAAVRTLAASHGQLTGAVLNTKAAFDALMSVLGAKVIIDRLVDYQKMELTLNAVSLSANEAASNMSFLQGITKQLGLEIITTGGGYGKLLASLEGSAFSLGDAKDIFGGMSVAMRALHLSSADAGRAFTALTQIMSKNQLQAEELKGQLGDVLPGAVSMMAKGMNISTAALMQMMKQGEITGKVLREALIGFVTAYVERYSPSLLQSLGGLQASFARLQNQFTEAVVYMGRNGLEDALVSITISINNLLKAMQDSGALKIFSEAIRSLAQNIQFLGYAIAGVGISRGIVAIAEGYRSIVGITSALSTTALAANSGTITRIIANLAASLRTFPALIAASSSAWAAFGLVLRAVGAGILAVFTALSANPLILLASVAAATAAWGLFNQATEEATAAANKQKLVMESLADTYDKLTSGSQQYSFVQDTIAKRAYETELGLAANLEQKVKSAEAALQAIGDKISANRGDYIFGSSEYRKQKEEVQVLNDELQKHNEILQRLQQQRGAIFNQKLVDPLVQVNLLSDQQKMVLLADENFRKVTESAQNLMATGDEVLRGQIFSQGVIQAFLLGKLNKEDALKLMELADKMAETTKKLFPSQDNQEKKQGGTNKLSYFEEQRAALERQRDTLLQVEDAYTQYYERIAEGSSKLNSAQARELGALADTNRAIKLYVQDAKTLRDLIDKTEIKTADPAFEPLLKYDQVVQSLAVNQENLNRIMREGNLTSAEKASLSAKLVEVERQTGDKDSARLEILRVMNIENNKALKTLQEKVENSNLSLQKTRAELDITGALSEALGARTAQTKIYNLELERSNELEKLNQSLLQAKAANGGKGDLDAVGAIQYRIEQVNKAYGQMISNEQTQAQLENLKKLSDYLKDIYGEMKAGVSDFFEALLTGSEYTFTKIGDLIKNKLIKAISGELADATMRGISGLFGDSVFTGSGGSGGGGILSSLFSMFSGSSSSNSLTSTSNSVVSGINTVVGATSSNPAAGLLSGVGNFLSGGFSSISDWIFGGGASTAESIAGISLPPIDGIAGLNLPALASGGGVPTFLGLSGIGGTLSGAGIGLGVGGLINGLIGGNAQNGGIGGLAGAAVGGGAGLAMGTILGMAGGPLGAIAGGLLGSVVGGLFGNGNEESDRKAIERQNEILRLQPELNKFYTDYAVQLSESGRQIAQLTNTFQSLSQRAKALGQDTDLLEDTFKKAKKAITDAFNENVELQISNFTNPSLGRYNELLSRQSALVKEAIEAEGDIAKVRELNILQMQDFLDNLTNAQLKLLGVLENAANEAYRQVDLLKTQISDLTNGITSSIDKQIAATNDAINAANTASSTYREFSKTLKETVQNLLTGNLTTLNPYQVYQTQGANFDSLAAKAAQGDTEAFGKLAQAANDFLSSSRGYNASSVPYANDFNKVIGILSSLGISAETLGSGGDDSVDILKTQVRVLEEIKKNLSADSPNAELLAKQLNTLNAITGVLNGTQNLTSTQLLQMAGITEGDLTVVQAITTGNNALVSGINQLVALQGQLVTAKQRADAIAEAEKRYNTAMDAKVADVGRVTSGFLGQVGGIKTVSPQANESSSQKRYNTQGTLVLSAGDRPSAQSEQRANALGSIMLGLTRQILTLTGGTGGAGFQLNISSKYGSGYVLTDTPGAVDKQQKFSINDYNGIISSFLMDWVKTIKGVPQNIVEILSKQSWGNVQTAMTGAASEIFRLQNPIDALQTPELYNQYAVGTNFAAPGLALVGENGPELVRFRGGEVVTPAYRTEELLSGDNSFTRSPSKSSEEVFDRGMSYLSTQIRSLITVLQETQGNHSEQLDGLNLKIKMLVNKLSVTMPQEAKGSRK